MEAGSHFGGVGEWLSMTWRLAQLLQFLCPAWSIRLRHAWSGRRMEPV
jgi:hypothetical protein